MINKKICLVIFGLFIIFVGINCSSAANYQISNTTDINTISKMVSGDLAIKNNKFIKDGDVIQFKKGNYYGLNLTVKKKIKITTTKSARGKVRFIGNGSGTFINVKSNKINVNALKIKNYEIAIKAKTGGNSFSKNVFYNNKIVISGNKNKIFKNNFIKSSVEINKKYNQIYSNRIKNSYIITYGNRNLIKSNKLQKSDITIQGNLNKVYQNKVYGASITGISVYGYKNIMKKNIIFRTQNGIDVNGKKHSLINNKISNCKYGIIYQSKSVILRNNVFKGNKKNIWYNPIVYPA
jgi:hypothetical protein